MTDRAETPTTTAPNSSDGAVRPAGADRHLGALILDGLLVAFTALIVVSALGLRGGAGMVPLVIGIPTLIGALYILVVDVRATLTAAAPAVEPDAPSLLDRIALEEEAEFETPEARRRQALFALWVVGFVALAWVTSFYVAVPVALVALFLIVRLHPVAIVIAVAGVVGLLYGLFDLFLRVRL